MNSKNQPTPAVVVPLLFAKRWGGGSIEPLLITCRTARSAGRWPVQITDAFDRALGVNSEPEKHLLDLLPILNKPNDTCMRFVQDHSRQEGRAANEDRGGESHIMMILLGLYALGADLTMAGNQFRQRLANWTASARPTAAGRLDKVGYLSVKLTELHRSRRCWRTGTDEHPPISRVLLPEANRAEIEDQCRSSSDDVFSQVVRRVEKRDGELLLFDDESADSPWVTLYFAKSFDEAIHLVFSTEKVQRLVKQIRVKQILKRFVIVAPFALSLIGLFTFLFTQTQRAENIRVPWENVLPDGERPSSQLRNTIEGLGPGGEVAWRRLYDGRILQYGELKTSDDSRRFWISLFNDGPNSGWLYVINDTGETLFRFHPGKRVPYEVGAGSRDFNLQFAPVMSADVLPEPGIEIVASAHCDWYPSKVCILSEDGRLLKTLWHPGSVSDPIVHVPGTSYLVFHGPNNHIRFGEALEKEWPPHEGAPPYHYTVHALDIASLPTESEAEPFILSKIDNAIPAFHFVILPRGIGPNHAPEVVENFMGEPNSEPLIRLGLGRDELIYHLDLHGKVVSKEPGPGAVKDQRRGMAKVFRFQHEDE